MDRELDLAVTYLVADGLFGPFTVEEWASGSNVTPSFNSREEAITLVDAHADEINPEDEGLLREIYGRFPI